MLTSCQSKGNKEIIHVHGVGLEKSSKGFVIIISHTQVSKLSFKEIDYLSNQGCRLLKSL